MKLLLLDSSKLPFQPKEEQVIYFDASPMSQKMQHHIAVLVDRYYDEIVQLFHENGLEFCFLPRISRSLHLPELIAYFRPDLSPEEYPKYLKTVQAEDLARYFVDKNDINRLQIGLIKYTGQEFGSNYVFSYIPLYGESQKELQVEIKDYIRFIKYSVNHSDVYIEDDEEEFFSSIDDASLYGTDDIQVMLSQAQELVAELRKCGVNEMVIEEIFHPTRKLSRMLIHNSRIFLTDYQNMEITMSPLPKAVYFLYLKHPEGINFSSLSDYRDELFDIYAGFSGRDSLVSIRASIDDLTNPLSNSINEKCSRIKQAFVQKFEDRLAQYYYITGSRGCRKSITLPRELVTWQ